MPPKKGNHCSKAAKRCISASSVALSFSSNLMKQKAIHDYLSHEDFTTKENNEASIKGITLKDKRKKSTCFLETTSPTSSKKSRPSSDAAFDFDTSISCYTSETKMSTSMESVEIQTPKEMRITRDPSEFSRNASNVYYGFTEDDQALLDEGELTEKDLQADFSDDELNMEITEDERKRMTEEEIEEYEKQKEQMEFANKFLGEDTMQLVRESDMLNIKFDCDHFTDLCRLSEIGLVRNESEYKFLGSVQLSELDLIFITDPESSCRNVLVRSFFSKYSNENKCVVEYDDIATLLHFIAQAPLKDANSLTTHKRLFIATENLLQSLKQVKYESMEKKQELCRINLELFYCSIVLCLDLSAWKSRFIVYILFNLCQVYLDLVVVPLKAKLSTVFEMIINSLADDKKVKVLSEFCIKLSHWNVKPFSLLTAMRTILPMLSRFRLFDEYRIRVAYYVFKAILSTTGLKDSKQINKKDSGEKKKISMMDVFDLVPKVVDFLADKPTDLYAAMQLLNTCTLDSMLKKQSMRTLIMLQDRMNVAKMHMKITIRLDDRIIDSLCDAPHRIQMVINAKRQAMIYSDGINSSEEDDE